LHRCHPAGAFLEQGQPQRDRAVGAFTQTRRQLPPKGQAGNIPVRDQQRRGWDCPSWLIYAWGAATRARRNARIRRYGTTLVQRAVRRENLARISRCVGPLRAAHEPYPPDAFAGHWAPGRRRRPGSNILSGFGGRLTAGRCIALGFAVAVLTWPAIGNRPIRLDMAEPDAAGSRLRPQRDHRAFRGLSPAGLG
jgi:hypothetical protein